MFHNKEDIEYFKPVKLRTRCGRLGHIKESLGKISFFEKKNYSIFFCLCNRLVLRLITGTHGHMKCVFDGQLKSFDTVFMYLYKRVFPKWTYEDCIVSVRDETNATTQNDNEMIE